MLSAIYFEIRRRRSRSDANSSLSRARNACILAWVPFGCDLPQKMANSIKPQYQICHSQQRSFLHCWSLRFFAVSTRCLDCTTLFCRVSACGSNRRRPDGQPAHQIGRSFQDNQLPHWPCEIEAELPSVEARVENHERRVSFPDGVVE